MSRLRCCGDEMDGDAKTQKTFRGTSSFLEIELISAI